MERATNFITLFILILGLSFFGCEEDPFSNDEPGTVEGIVTDANTGEAISDAVINNGTNDVAISMNDGTYSYQDDPGTYTLTCTAEGFGMQLIEDVEVEAGETVEANFQMQPITVINIENNIVGSTTWTNNNIYVINGEIMITGVLTISPGTLLKFKDNASFIIDGDGDGMILAEGTSLMPIIFTSWHDDSYGGDTNGNANATQPARGDWNYISISGVGNQSIFDHCMIYYGGGFVDGYVLELKDDSDVSITNCVIAHNQGEEGAVCAKQAGAGTIIQNNIFYDNIWPLQINCTYDIDNSNFYHNPAESSETNDFNGIKISSMVFEGDIIWSETEIPFVLEGGELSIGQSESLTLAPGVMIKLLDNDWWVHGTLIAEGTLAEPIWFTSYKDDTVGGDTNNDESTTSASSGDWSYIKVLQLSNDSSFNYCNFYYGGGHNSHDYTLILDGETMASVTSCKFVYNKGMNDCVLNAWQAGSSTSIAGNTFYNNERPLKINGSISLDSSNTFHNLEMPSQTNIYNGIFVDQQGFLCEILGDISWSETEVPFVANNQGISIDVDNSLTITENVIIKFDNGVLNYQGDNLIGYDENGVWFTSYHDDEHGGDTNGNGAVTNPAEGDWQGIHNVGASPDLWEIWDNILYEEIN